MAAALLAHGAAYWAGVWALSSAAVDLQSWLLCYAASVVVLVTPHWLPQLGLSRTQCCKLFLYSTVVAIWLWGSNFALDELGNSVQAKRLPTAERDDLPLHFILFPGVAAVAIGAFFSVPRRRALSTGPAPERERD